jgi:hypothetical protein
MPRHLAWPGLRVLAALDGAAALVATRPATVGPRSSERPRSDCGQGSSRYRDPSVERPCDC